MLDQDYYRYQIYKHQNRESANLLGRYYPTKHSLCFPNQRMVRMAVAIDYQWHIQPPHERNTLRHILCIEFWGNPACIEHQPFESIRVLRKLPIMSKYGIHSSPSIVNGRILRLYRVLVKGLSTHIRTILCNLQKKTMYTKYVVKKNFPCQMRVQRREEKQKKSLMNYHKGLDKYGNFY